LIGVGYCSVLAVVHILLEFGKLVVISFRVVVGILVLVGSIQFSVGLVSVFVGDGHELVRVNTLR